MKTSRIILRFVQAALGLFFIWSGAIKLPDLSDFTQTVANYQIVGRPWDAVAAYFVPWVEIIVGLSLVTGVMARGGLVISFLMLTGFSVAIAWVWNQGLNINCGCFGSSDEPTHYGLHLLANGGLILVTIALLVFGYLHQRSSPQA